MSSKQFFFLVKPQFGSTNHIIDTLMVSTVHVNSDTQASSQVRGHKPSSMWRSLLTSLAGLSIFPNPFNPRTAITFTIDHAQNVKLSIFDMTGKCIYVLANREFQAGAHSMDWQGRD